MKSTLLAWKIIASLLLVVLAPSKVSSGKLKSKQDTTL
jgi:hypothetical protein